MAESKSCCSVPRGRERARERREKWEIFFWSQKSFTMTVSQIHLNFYLLSTSVNLACGWLCSCLWWFTNASLSRKVHGKISHPDHFKNKNSLQNVEKFLPLILEPIINDWGQWLKKLPLDSKIHQNPKIFKAKKCKVYCPSKRRLTSSRIGFHYKLPKHVFLFFGVFFI